MSQPQSDSPTGDGGQVDYVALCQPRPVPVLWALDIVKVPDGETQKLLAKSKLLSWNGEHVSYWPLETLDRYVKDLRGVMRVMAEAQTGLATPGGDRSDTGLILPPGVG